MEDVLQEIGLHGYASGTVVSLALMLLTGLLASKLTQKLHLPDVTAYILSGILLGPFCLNVIPKEMIDGTGFLTDIALALIAFGTGEFFKLSSLRKNGLKVIVITVFEALAASLFVFAATYLFMGIRFPFALVLSALASTTAPASTLMTIRQTNARGDFVDTLLQVVALDDAVGIAVFSAAVAFASAKTEARLGNLLVPLLCNAGTTVLGCLFGFVMKLVVCRQERPGSRLITATAVLLSFCAICSLLDVSPLLGCILIGTFYVNLSGDETLFSEINAFSPPILLLFFVRSGLGFDLGALFDRTETVGGAPLVLIGIVYFITRILGKYAGAYAGCLCTGKKPAVRNYLGLALIPHAGVAIGLAAFGAGILGGDEGTALNTVILASSVLYELAGPACAKLALWLSKSYP